MADVLMGVLNGLPLMRQQFFNVLVLLRRQTHQDIFQIGVRIVPIELGRLNQAHNGRRPLARPQGASEEPVLAT